jgi:hypothetical protein
MSTQFDVRYETAKRKFPRLFLAIKSADLVPLPDVFLVWPDRTQSVVLDLSESGILVSSTGILGQTKLGQHLDVRLRVGGADPKSLQVKVMRLTAGCVLLSLDALTIAARLKLEQDVRENLILSSWRALPTNHLHPSFHASTWWHSAFDSNIWVWRDSAGVLQKMIVEFESVAFVYDGNGSRFLRTPSAFDEAKGYVGPYTEPLPNKVEPGHDWTQRLLKIMVPGSQLSEELVAEIRGLIPKSGLAKTLHV